MVNADHRLRGELLLPRADRRVGSIAWFQAEAEQVLRLGIDSCSCSFVTFRDVALSNPAFKDFNQPRPEQKQMNVSNLTEEHNLLNMLCTSNNTLPIPQAQLRAKLAWRKAAARARVVFSQGSGRIGRDWLRRSFSRGRRRGCGDGEDADEDGASMSSRLREVVVGACLI